MLNFRKMLAMTALAGSTLGMTTQDSQAPKHPVVQPGPSEPDWLVLLDRLYHLDMEKDLQNPMELDLKNVRSLFRKAGPGPVWFVPEIALGLEVPIHGGFYLASDQAEPPKTELWSYQHKSTTAKVESGEDLTPPLKAGSRTTFDPGDQPFGLFIGNDQFQDYVFSEPTRVASLNQRLAKQPYKAMIYPYRDRKTGKLVPNAYLIGWEYSTNDDFQDVVCRIENVNLIDPKPEP